MTPNTSSGIDGSQCLAFAGRGRDLHVRLAAETAPDDLAWAIGLFLPRWPFRRVSEDITPDISVTFRDDVYCVRATSWAGGESLAKDPHNAANALAGLLIDGLLAHGMAAHCLHAAGVEIGGRAVLFCGPGHAGKSTLALRLAVRGFRHLADDRILLTTADPPHHVAALGLAAKARAPLPPGRGLAELVAGRWQLADETVSYLHLEGAEAADFGHECPLGALVVPRRDPSLKVAAELQQAPPGEIARTLIEETTSPAGPAVIVPAMTRLADSVDGFILSYRDGDAAADRLADTFDR